MSEHVRQMFVGHLAGSDGDSAADIDLIHRHSRSFSLASKMLPAAVRADVQKLYAWCRWCDDAVDTAANREAAAAELAVLREDIERIYRGELPHHQASQWLATLVDKYQIDEAHPLALIEGMETDLSLEQIKSEKQLLKYCYHAAGVVGLMMCRVLGVTDPRAARHAESLGTAMQLTNIARDVREDWQRGRCYLPETWLSIRNDGRPPSDDEVRPAIQRLLELADQHYAMGLQGLSFLPNRTRGAIGIASAVYREIGQEIRRNDYRVMQGRTVVPKFRFVLAAIAGWRRGLTPNARLQFNRHSQNQVNFEHPFMNMETIVNDAKYVIYLGISLTAFMGCALFLLVMLNPKEESYSWLPALYSVICFGVGVVTNRMAKRAESLCEASVRAGHDS